MSGFFFPKQCKVDVAEHSVHSQMSLCTFTISIHSFLPQFDARLPWNSGWLQVNHLRFAWNSGWLPCPANVAVRATNKGGSVVYADSHSALLVNCWLPMLYFLSCQLLMVSGLCGRNCMPAAWKNCYTSFHQVEISYRLTIHWWLMRACKYRFSRFLLGCSG